MRGDDYTQWARITERILGFQRLINRRLDFRFCAFQADELLFRLRLCKPNSVLF
jgi:hypothetical protein